MDAYSHTNKRFRLAILTAVVLSAMIVTVASVVGRQVMNMQAALVAGVPSNITILALAAEDHPELAPVEFVERQPQRSIEEYVFVVTNTAGEKFLVNLGRDKTGRWRSDPPPEKLFSEENTADEALFDETQASEIE